LLCSLAVKISLIDAHLSSPTGCAQCAVTARRFATLDEGKRAPTQSSARIVVYTWSMGIPKCPLLAADVVIEVADRIVLIERKNFPFGWALPGGFVEIGETVEQTATREALEETSLAVELRALLGVYSRPDRDPRGHTVTVVYVGRAQGVPKARDDASNVALFSCNALPQPLAFDHAQVLADYREFLITGRPPAPAKQVKTG